MTTQTKTQPVPSSQPRTSAIRAAGAAGAIGAAVTVWLPGAAPLGPEAHRALPRG